MHRRAGGTLNVPGADDNECIRRRPPAAAAPRRVKAGMVNAVTYSQAVDRVAAEEVARRVGQLRGEHIAAQADAVAGEEGQ